MTCVKVRIVTLQLIHRCKIMQETKAYRYCRERRETHSTCY